MRWTTGLLVIAACGGGAGAPDARPGPDAYVPADGVVGPDGTPLAWVDIAASGCAPGGGGGGDAGAAPLTCTGAAPLTVTFASLASGPLTTWAWSFGDGGAATAATPTHTFVRPGAYDVTLAAAGPGGSTTVTRPGFVVVTPAPLGAACGEADQCASGACACGDAACDPGASLCAAPCGGGCAGVCGALGGGWDASLCLATCAMDADCPPGRACEAIATPGGAAAWAKACVPAGALAPIGAACAGPGGLDPSRCASGDCLGVGARGACALGCAGGAACPDGTACATFGNGTAACLPSCDSAHPCGDDPWLACEGPGANGPWGFTLPASGSVCAPKACSGASDCPGGACVAGHCAAS